MKGAVAALALALAACTPAHIIAPVLVAGGLTAQQAAVAATALSDTAEVACALQHAANDIAPHLKPGSRSLAFATAMSRYLGWSCAW